MKLKGLSKIAIAGAALAATAATLATSTYAWYVSNDNVAMSGVTGATAGTEVGSNLIIAGNTVGQSGDTPHSWGPSLTLAAAADRSAYNTTNTSDKFLAEALNPQSMDTSAQSETWKDADGVELSSTSFIEFKVWIKNSKAALITPLFGIAHDVDNETLKTQTAYNPNGLPTGVTPDSNFTADAIQALRMQITYNSTTTFSTAVTETYKVASMAKTLDLNGAYTTDTNRFADPSGDANLYYKNMKNKTAFNTTGFDISDRTAGTGASNANVYAGELGTWSPFNVAAEEPVKLTFRIWLEGADSDCWDSCISQMFKFSLKFTAQDVANNQNP